MYVLGIESTCDETAASVVKDGHLILSNIIYSQAEKHAAYGGVYPEVASRAHIEALIPVIDEALREAGISKGDLDLIAVAKAPGLIGGLLIGIEAAKGLSLGLGIPFVGVNHVEAHLYAAMMAKDKISFPSLGVVLSGGHTLLVKIEAMGKYEVLGTTLDDALGEAFDKLAVMLGFTYPGGPMIEKLAAEGRASQVKLTAGKIKDKPFAFSYSGLKTACRMLIEKEKNLSLQFKQDLAASFQQTVFKDLSMKIQRACHAWGLSTVYLGGGVVCNQALRETLLQNMPDIELVFSPKALCVDNAAMIAGLGFHRFNLQGISDLLDLLPETRTPQF